MSQPINTLFAAVFFTGVYSMEMYGILWKYRLQNL